MHVRHPSHRAAILALFLLTVAGCSATSIPFDATLVNEATALKRDVDAELAQASQPFAQHEPAVTALEGRLQAAADRAATVPNNGNSAAQWRLMADPAQGLAGGMFARWRRDGTLNPVVIEDGRRQVGEGFDFILCLERNKKQPQTCTPGGGN